MDTTKFYMEDLKWRNHLKGLDTDMKATLKHNEQIGWEGAERIKVAQDRHQCRALVKTAMTLRFHKIQANTWSAKRLSSFQEPPLHSCRTTLQLHVSLQQQSCITIVTFNCNMWLHIAEQQKLINVCVWKPSRIQNNGAVLLTANWF
jgi:hypothetical protein